MVGVGLDPLSSVSASLGAVDMTRKTAKRNVVGAGVEIGLGIRAGLAAGHGIRKAASDEVCRLLSGGHFCVLLTLLHAAIWQYLHCCYSSSCVSARVYGVLCVC